MWGRSQITSYCFQNFLTSKNIFITLQYSGDILGIFLKQTFVECSSNILETLLRDYWNLPKDQHLLLSNHTLLTQKQLFHRELFKKSFPLKCSLDVTNIATLREHSANIPGILRVCWVTYVEECYFQFTLKAITQQQAINIIYHEIQQSLTDVFHYQRTI